MSSSMSHRQLVELNMFILLKKLPWQNKGWLCLSSNENQLWYFSTTCYCNCCYHFDYCFRMFACFTITVIFFNLFNDIYVFIVYLFVLKVVSFVIRIIEPAMRMIWLKISFRLKLNFMKFTKSPWKQSFLNCISLTG